MPLSDNIKVSYIETIKTDLHFLFLYCIQISNEIFLIGRFRSIFHAMFRHRNAELRPKKF